MWQQEILANNLLKYSVAADCEKDILLELLVLWESLHCIKIS